ncbi:MAG: GTPase [Massilia sp.]|nr:GTPase [Massilia sp.]
MPARVSTTLVTGVSAGVRERCIAAHVAAQQAPVGSGNHNIGTLGAILLEGLPDGHTVLVPSPALLIERIAPGCLCCTGNLVLRVTLNRLLRRRPAWLVIGLATTEHLDQLRSWLQASPYDQLLALGPGLHA